MDHNRQFQLITRALHWLEDHRTEQPSLSQLSEALNVSPFHLQKTFQSWAGLTPKQFVKSLTRDEALERLAAGESVLDTALATGLSGPGRLHDLMVSTQALTPGEVRRRGENVTMHYGFGDTPFGVALAAWTPRGLSFLGFCSELGAETTLARLRATWPMAEFQMRTEQARRWLDRIFTDRRDQPISLWLSGSPFQLKVWEALLAIPEGALASYSQVARSIDQPKAARAVGAAIGSNPVAWLVPCHRVIRDIGEAGGYRWGALTKRALITYESRSAAPPVTR